MRLNVPVSNIEYVVSDRETIVSTTDLKGNINYANPYFIEVSGFTQAELIGAPQNILRHPDMPIEAFSDLWQTIKSGLPWTGMVKNRCKNGDFYWVLANVTPVMESGKPVGYMSVRTKPSRSQIDAASALYAEMKNGNPNRITLCQGRAVRGGWRSRLAALSDISLATRIALTLVTLMTTTACLGLFAWRAGNGWLSAMAACALLLLGWFWTALAGGVVRPLAHTIKAVQTMAGGDLTATIETSRTDEIGQLLRATRQLNINMRSIIGDVRNGVELMTEATREIASGNMELSGRTEAQASALEETASSMEQLAATVLQNAGNASEANTMAGDAAKIAGTGGVIVDKMVVTIEEISASSKKIVEIISMIDAIAFQTNILALNAAVEAARAGEQGRGFAVVASEVRTLAQRSASAAKEIKLLIDLSVDKVSAGTLLARDAGVTMRNIIGSVDRVSGIMSAISDASAEQNAGIGQVNQAVMEMDEVTQKNAALVEQAAATSAGLAQQADVLMQTLTVFKLSAGANTVASAQQRATGQRRPVARIGMRGALGVTPIV